MYGNAKEWTHSWYERYDEWSHQVEPIGWAKLNSSNNQSDQDGGYNRIARGGSYKSAADECRSASRQKTNINSTSGMGYRAWCRAVIP